MFLVFFTNCVLRTIFVFYDLFWVAKQVFYSKNRKLVLKTQNKEKNQLLKKTKIHPLMNFVKLTIGLIYN